ncbi:MAG TPA: hypothetical protein VK533_14470 [Sphingomonas sp.]|uniref:hypothetical protein n=1 Tax=Sphingomonas sp. TaxID=28214 RepID=UPI002BB74990|nr:hypothetical protein [Sphingomonas sp.]HMI20738.1 hypothetical protein [Sphingomonas sp.]
MAVAKLREEYLSTQASAAPAPQLGSDLGDFASTPSPVLALQQHLAQRTVAATATDVDKWSPRRSLALIVSASAALWMAILMMGAEATKLIA